MACEKQIDFYLPYPVLDVFARMSREPYIGKMKVDFVDQSHYRILCSTGANMMTWGEQITISFFDPQDGGTRIIAESKPKLPTTLVDWGHNQENVMNVMNHFMYLYPPQNGQAPIQPPQR